MAVTPSAPSVYSLPADRAGGNIYHAPLRADLSYYIEALYNHRRLPSALDYVSPVAYQLLFHQGAGIP